MNSSPEQSPAYRQPPDRLRQFIAVFTVLGSFIVNLLSNLYPINGQNIGAISNTLFGDVLITPANYAFAIWGLIYIGLLAFAVYQFLSPAEQHPQLQSITYWFLLASLAQGVWVYLFLARQFGWSVLAMLIILGSLIAIFLQLHSHKRASWKERWLLRYPFGVYLGWIAVATVVNVAIALYGANWNGWGIAPEIWTVVMMVVAAALAAALLWQYRSFPYAFVALWALVAIAIRQADVPLIQVTGWVLVALLGGLVAYTFRRKPRLAKADYNA
ncbi:tryptophan-rich sensory protein [Leptolyngbya sp. AN02str]|uniref:tryptophan-rich sensory protein n=1 Tax=Leptolyngbya sp. AN02str TaxID=3423363 RepID=UPI003D30F94B